MEENTDNIFNSIISFNTAPSENDVVQLVNELIIKKQLECPRIRSLKSLNSSFFSQLFQNVFGYQVPDAIINPSTKEEDIHNVQSVIDTLSLDILSISLSHITGEDIVAKNPGALYSLLRIFKGYLAVTEQKSQTSLDSFCTNSSVFSIHSKNNLPKVEKDATSRSDSKVSSSSISSTYVSESSTEKSSSEKISSKTSLSQITGKSKPKSFRPIIHLKSEDDDLSSLNDLISEPLDNLYKEVFKPVPRRRVMPVRKRSVLIPRCLKGNSPKISKMNIVPKSESRSVSGGFISEIKAALPGIELSNETKNVMRKQCVDHLKFMTNTIHDLENKKRKAQKDHEDAVLKQRKLLNMAKKDAEKERKVAEAKQAKLNRIRIQSILKDHDLRKARMNKYYKNYHLGHRKRMSVKPEKEEMLFKNVLKERLNLQKEDLNRVNKEMREMEGEEAIKFRRNADAMANFYETQMALLKEEIDTKKTSFNVRVKSQQRALDDFKRETRLKIEREVEEIQDDLERRDDFHFRENDAERLRQSWK